jgi:hypothetical protein
MIKNKLNNRYSVRIGVVANYAYLFLMNKSGLKFISIGGSSYLSINLQDIIFFST